MKEGPVLPRGGRVGTTDPAIGLAVSGTLVVGIVKIEPESVAIEPKRSTQVSRTAEGSSG